MFRELRKFEDELLDEAQSLSIESGLDDSNPNSSIEELFAAAAKLKCYLFNNLKLQKIVGMHYGIHYQLLSFVVFWER